MKKIKLNSNLIQFMSIFQSVTRVSVRDCLEALDKIIFIVNENTISRAIGKNGENVKKLERLLNRKIKIVEFNPEVTRFVQKLIYPYKAKEINQEEGIITIVPEDTRARGMIIGRNAATLRVYEDIVKRYFQVEEIKVI